VARKPKTEREFSAGGVVVRGDEVVVIVPTRRGPKGERTLTLPKGHPDPGESMKEAAAREVREEAGVEGELLAKLGDVKYFYQRDGRRIFKEARWIGLAEAATQLSFAGEREMVGRAMSRRSSDR